MANSNEAPTLLWAQEFGGPGVDGGGVTGAPNPRFWGRDVGDGTSIGNPGWGNSELQVYTEKTNAFRCPITGLLEIEARRVGAVAAAAVLSLDASSTGVSGGALNASSDSTSAAAATTTDVAAATATTAAAFSSPPQTTKTAAALTADASTPAAAGNTYYGPAQWTSARLVTKNRLHVHYGRVAIRAKMPQVSSHTHTHTQALHKHAYTHTANKTRTHAYTHRHTPQINKHTHTHTHTHNLAS